MAQRRLSDYQDPLGSFEHNLVRLGVHFPGRFCGFDTFTSTGGLTFSISHNKGVTTYDINSIPYGPLGVAMTRQGVIVLEDAVIPGLVLETNLGNPELRLDQLVMTHQQVEVAGGLDAVYEVVKGGPSQSLGALSPFQVVLGIITIPAEASTSSGCTYERATNPDSGDSPDAKLDKVNKFATLNENNMSPRFSHSNDPETVSTDLNNLNGVPGKKWNVYAMGNSHTVIAYAETDLDLLRIVGGSNQEGTEINLCTNENLRLRHNTPLSPAEIAAGYGNILISDSFRDLPTNSYKPSGNGVSTIYSLLKLSGSWYVRGVTQVSTTPTNPGNPPPIQTHVITYQYVSFPYSGNFMQIYVNNTLKVNLTTNNGSGSLTVNHGDTIKSILNSPAFTGSRALTLRTATPGGDILDNRSGPSPITLQYTSDISEDININGTISA